MFVDPGKYDYVTCEQLINLRKQWAERELELKVLMDKAEQSTSGVVVNFIAYQADHAMAHELTHAPVRRAPRHSPMRYTM